MIRRLFAAALAAGGAIGAASAGEPAFVAPQTLEELDARIAEALEGSAVIGMQVALVDAGGASWANSYGHLDKERARPVSNDSVFRAGSISKSFTGVLAQMLVEDGVLDLGERLADAAPEIAFANRWEASHPVLLVDLSEHTTGWDDIQFSEYRDFGPDAAITEGLAFNPKSRTARWKPGRYASYNNAGPAILGHVMEKKTGRSFDDLVQSRIFDPLDMENVSFRLTDGVAAKLSKSYSAKGVEEPYVHIGMPPSGSLNTSASELAKFVALLIRRGEAGGAQIVSPEGVLRIETPTRSLAAQGGLKMGYGLGVFSMPTRDYGVVSGHNGGIDGFLAEYGYFGDSGTGYVMMLNAPDGAVYRKVRTLLHAYLRAQHPAPAPLEAAADADLSQYEGVYRQITPRSDFLRVLLDVFDIARIEARDGKLIVAPPVGEGVDLLPLGGGLFVAEGGTQADRILLLSPEGEMRMIRATMSAYARVGVVDAYWRLALFVLAALGAVVAALSQLLWIALRPFGLFRAGGRWKVWTAPLLAYSSLAVLAGAFILGAQGNSAAFTANLGAPGVYSLAATAATLAFALFAALSAARVFAAKGVSRGARATAGFAALTLAALALYLALYGWIGMTIWSYQPAATGV